VLIAPHSVHQTQPTVTMTGKFEPKEPVQLAPPKDDPISLEELAQATGARHFFVIYPQIVNFSVKGSSHSLLIICSNPHPLYDIV